MYQVFNNFRMTVENDSSHNKIDDTKHSSDDAIWQKIIVQNIYVFFQRKSPLLNYYKQKYRLRKPGHAPGRSLIVEYVVA